MSTISGTSHEIFKELNESQINAVTATEGYIRVIAGAGTGKTKTLTHRYAYLINEQIGRAHV